MKNPYDWIEHSLQVIERANWTRSVKAISQTQAGGAEIEIDGKMLINFGSNDYLGFATHPEIKAAAIAAIEDYGTSATGSRLTSGQRPIHRQLETAIANWKQTEDALVFSSGYLANLSTIQAVVTARDLILADQYNHASLKNGAKLSGASILEFDHASPTDLEAKLKLHRSQYRRCLIASDGVFSMDGDLCPLGEMLDLANQFNAMVLIDDAHATGVIGKSGAGTLEHFNQTGYPVIQVGTFSKALGSLGGFVAGNQSLINFLRNRGSGWIYTTGLSPADCGAALKAIELCRSEPHFLNNLHKNIEAFSRQFQDLTETLQTRIHQLDSSSAIICLEVETPETVLRLSQALAEQGCFVPGIRPPTVPTSRLRISLMASHHPEHLKTLIQSLATTLEGE